MNSKLDPKALSVTPEEVYLQRRHYLRLFGMAATTWPLAGCTEDAKQHKVIDVQANSADADPMRASDPLTRFEDATSYNNFYEFGTGKGDPRRHAGQLRTTPWEIHVSGLVEEPRSFSLLELLPETSRVERIYRLRCVEAWSMVIPWQGVPLAEVIERCKPLPDAAYIAFDSLADPTQMPGIRQATLEWPYTEALRMDEALHPLSLMATGMYRRSLPPQNGAPVRLVVPWKYGFKSIKSIVSIRFTREPPETTWNRMQPSEYGFFANVNPDVDHPRWSQRSERRLAGDGNRAFAPRIATLPFNGYAKQVEQLYRGMDLHQWF
ncbi:MAG: Sulfoxide reductase catalytic subunit YedY precursor [Alphaproteobacteria bacterium ADurb.BinA280]|jgi:sulfoxide reductase catalytic subunit YedY|nr:MAG: Sulfoxide reductase catalytic subunit YedY precursor [Alphaproteobacteria bacterium ADurb.BinA280]